jgi:2-polyprenyl-3-methyl-5-hydroxy-6-metoxy-1,4-benzoquinol methylase
MMPPPSSDLKDSDRPRASSVERATDAAARATDDVQERNRLWWEQLPMTYEPWEGERRTPTTKQDFERLNATYLGSNPWIPTNVNFGAFRDKRVLEIGCGGGTASVCFALGGALVTSVDLTEAAAAMTTANARLQGAELTAIRMDAEELAFPDASFDYVYSWGVIHHSSHPDRIFAQVARVLARGGRGLVMVYNRNSARYYLLGLLWLIARGKILQGYTLESVQRFFTDGYYQRHYRPAELRDELARHGLHVQRTAITYMAGRMIPGLPRRLDELLKERVGWLLVVEFVKG